MAEGIVTDEVRTIQAVKEKVHHPEKIGHGLFIDAEQGVFLQTPPVLYALHLRLQVLVGLDQEAAGAPCGVQNSLAKTRVDLLDDEPDDWPGRIELTRVSCCIANLGKHGLVEVAQCVDVVRRIEVDSID
jgi:hypothetical protein